jgi:hypothetical protein
MYLTGTGLDFLRELVNGSGWNKSTTEFNKTQLKKHSISGYDATLRSKIKGLENFS